MSDEGNRIKTPTTFEEQVNILESRGLKINDKEKTIGILSRINYYRLSAYMLTFKTNDEFEGEVTFQEIYELYEFDKRLRKYMCSLWKIIQ